MILIGVWVFVCNMLITKDQFYLAKSSNPVSAPIVALFVKNGRLQRLATIKVLLVLTNLSKLFHPIL